MPQPTYSHKKSMNALLDILTKKYSLDQFGMSSQLLTEQERKHIINAGVETTYKKRTKP